jgi:hypothetical protein
MMGIGIVMMLLFFHLYFAHGAGFRPQSGDRTGPKAGASLARSARS